MLKKLKTGFPFDAFPCFLFGYLVLMMTIALTLAYYPSGNDFAGFTWLVENASLGNPTTLASGVYPLGGVLFFKSLFCISRNHLLSMKIVTVLVSGGALLVVYLLFRDLLGEKNFGMLAAITLGLSNIFVVGGVFSTHFDIIPAFLVLLGYYILLCKELTFNRCIVAGLLTSFAYLFRFHFLVVGPATVFGILVFLNGEIRERLLYCLTYTMGWLLGASPSILVNLLVHGSPFYNSGSYVIAWVVLGERDWYNFPNTYALYTLRDVLTNHFPEFVNHVKKEFFVFLKNLPIVIGMVSVFPLLFSSAEEGIRRKLLFLLTAAAIYSFSVMTSIYTARAYLLPFIIFTIVFFAGIVKVGDFAAEKASLLTKRAYLFLFSGIAIVIFFGWHLSFNYIQEIYHAKKTNQRIVDALSQAGMKKSDEVFSFDYNVLNVNDPKMQPFYGFGGWLYLEPEYANKRPFPDVASIDRFIGFLNEQNIRYVVLNTWSGYKFPGLPPFYALQSLEGFSPIHREQGILVLKRNTDAVPK